MNNDFFIIYNDELHVNIVNINVIDSIMKGE